jgi:DNA-binding MarR family transcriptional regulator
MNHRTLILNQYFPYFLGTVANKWASTSSKLYLSQFGIGIAAWRVLASIYSKGEATSLDVVNHISMDAGAVSRAVRQLEADGYLQKVNGRFPGRTRPYSVTGDGKKLYMKIMKIALKREELLLSGISDRERKVLIKVMQKILGNLEQF